MGSFIDEKKFDLSGTFGYYTAIKSGYDKVKPAVNLIRGAICNSICIVRVVYGLESRFMNIDR